MLLWRGPCHCLDFIPCIRSFLVLTGIFQNFNRRLACRPVSQLLCVAGFLAFLLKERQSSRWDSLCSACLFKTRKDFRTGLYVMQHCAALGAKKMAAFAHLSNVHLKAETKQHNGMEINFIVCLLVYSSNFEARYQKLSFHRP